MTHEGERVTTDIQDAKHTTSKEERNIITRRESGFIFSTLEEVAGESKNKSAKEGDQKGGKPLNKEESIYVSKTTTKSGCITPEDRVRPSPTQKKT